MLSKIDFNALADNRLYLFATHQVFMIGFSITHAHSAHLAVAIIFSSSSSLDAWHTREEKNRISCHQLGIFYFGFNHCVWKLFTRIKVTKLMHVPYRAPAAGEVILEIQFAIKHRIDPYWVSAYTKRLNRNDPLRYAMYIFSLKLQLLLLHSSSSAAFKDIYAHIANFHSKRIKERLTRFFVIFSLRLLSIPYWN